MTDAERPDDQPEEERSADSAPAEEEAEAARAGEADSDEDATAAPDGDAGTDDTSGVEAGAGEQAIGDEAGEQDATAADDSPAAAAPEAGQAAEAPDEQAAAAPDAEQAAAAPDAEQAAETTPPPAERGRRVEAEGTREESIPGAHLEPDLVLEQAPETEEPDYSRYADTDSEAELATEAAAAGDPTAAREPTDREAPEPEPRSALDLAADARYPATGKRKTSVARVILRPGTGAYTINGRTLEQFFPRATLQLAARQPLQTAGYADRMDVVARLHGGGVSSQAGALRHGIARALVEADPALRGELKRHGFLTRDARAKERKKAGLKKARKRPQFSKR